MNTLLYPKKRLSAFSLIEVVIAVGIFAISIVAVIGLLGPTNKSVADVRDTDDSTRVVGAIQAQLQTIAAMGKYPLATSTTSGFDYIATTYLQSPTDTAITSGGNTGAGYTIYASRDGNQIGLGTDSTVWNPSGSLSTDQQNAQKYFEIVLIRNTDLSPGPDTSAGFLAFTIRLRSPAYLPDGSLFSDNTQKSVLLVPAAVHR